MNAIACPSKDQLSELLEAHVADDAQSSIVRHLDTCESCQGTLEALAVGDANIPKVIQADLPMPAAGKSAYFPAVAKLKSDSKEIVRRSGAGNAETIFTDSSGASTVTEEPTLDFLQPADAPGLIGRIDDFDIVEVIGRGGMGVVLKAFDNCLHRYVAIKVVASMGSCEVACGRFIREVRSAASIRHDNVVPIYTVDEINNRPYLVMEYIPGKSLDHYMEERGPLELKDLLRISAQVARGLAAAHAQGVVHRDIKPANILMDGAEKVKITDFGLARAMEDGRLTQSGIVVGTPQYMSPEQAQGKSVDHRADLFSLGSLMYAMATGRAPFNADSTVATLLAVVKDKPRPAREVNPNVPEWLSEVIEKLHEKEPGKRFQSAKELMDLVGQHWCQLKLAQHGHAPAPAPTAKPNGRGWSSTIGRILGGVFGRSTNGGGQALASQAVATAIEPSTAPPRAVLDAGTGPVWSLAFSGDDRTLAMALDDGTVKLWDPAGRRVRATLNAHRGPVWAVAFAPSGNLLATAGDDGNVKLWDITAGKEVRSIKNGASVRSVAFDSSGSRIATGSRDGTVRIFDALSGERRVSIDAHTGVVMSLAFSPDGETLITSSGDRTAKLWNAENGLEQLVLSGHAGGVHAVAFSPDGRRAATGSWDKQVMLWDPGTGTRLATLAGHEQDIWSVVFSPNGRRLASASEDRSVRVWDVNSGEILATYRGHTGSSYAVAFSHDGQTIASGARDGTVRLWDAR
jgi:eukaryotic-like serine/threonine-protein kinase